MHLYNQILILGDFKEEIIVSHSFVSYKSKQLGSKFKQLGNNGISSCRGRGELWLCGSMVEDILWLEPIKRS